MFGLEYLCNLYDMQQTELAEKVGVSKQIVNIWMKRTRPIPKKYYDKLSKIFGGLDPKYFAKDELTELDKLEIQMIKLDSEWIAEEYEEEVIDPCTGEYERDKDGNVIIRKGIYTDRGQQMYRERLEYEIDEAKLINRLKQTLAKEFYLAEQREAMDGGLSDAQEILNLYELFIKIIEKGGISRNTLRRVLNGVNTYQNKKTIEDDDFTKAIVNKIEEEESRLRKEAEYWIEKSKGMDDLFK